MSDINDAQHPQDPAEGADFDEDQAGDRVAHPQDPAEGTDVSRGQGGDAQQQNQQRELNDGDDATQPGGDEPTD